MDPFLPDEAHGPPIMVVWASDDCLRPLDTLWHLTREHIAENYPVVQLAITGQLQEAYTENPGLDLEEYVSEE